MRVTYRGHTIERRSVTDWRVTSLSEVGAEQIIHLTAARARKWIDGYLCRLYEESPEGERALERLRSAVFDGPPRLESNQP